MSQKISAHFTSTLDGNLAFHVGDVKENVEKNHQRLAKKYHFDLNQLKYMNQVHGSNITIVTETSAKESLECDALITARSNVPLMVMVADCIPILMYDEKKGVIAAIHAGRNSTFEKIAEKTVLKMQEAFGCAPEDICVKLGPSIQKCCYEVSPQLAQIVKTSFGDEFVNGRLIDLQGINVDLLRQLGVVNIDLSSVCTKCSGKNYFSYRLDKNTGRFCGLIIKKDT